MSVVEPGQHTISTPLMDLESAGGAGGLPVRYRGVPGTLQTAGPDDTVTFFPNAVSVGVGGSEAHLSQGEAVSNAAASCWLASRGVLCAK